MDDFGSNIRRNAEIGPRDRWAQKQANGLWGTLIFGCFGVGLFGSAAYHLLPGWLVEIALIGFLAGAITYGLWTSRRARKQNSDEYASGFARTDEEVRQALADIEARKK